MSRFPPLALPLPLIQALAVAVSDVGEQGAPLARAMPAGACPVTNP